MGKVCGITHPYFLVHHHALHLAIPVGYCANRERAIHAGRDRIERNGRPMLPWWVVSSLRIATAASRTLRILVFVIFAALQIGAMWLSLRPFISRH